MSHRIRLVRNNTRPVLEVSLTSELTGEPTDLTDPALSVKLYFRGQNATEVTAVLDAIKLAGRLMIDGTVETASPWDVPGAGGRCAFLWTPQAVGAPSGNYDGEIQITFPDASTQVVFDRLRFRLRDDILT